MPHPAHTCKPAIIDAMFFLVDLLSGGGKASREVDAALLERFERREASRARAMLEHRGIVAAEGGVVRLTMPQEKAQELIDCIREYGRTFGFPDKPRPARAEKDQIDPKLRACMRKAVQLCDQWRIVPRATLLDVLAETWPRDLAEAALTEAEDRGVVKSSRGRCCLGIPRAKADALLKAPESEKKTRVDLVIQVRCRIEGAPEECAATVGRLQKVIDELKQIDGATVVV